MLHYFGYNTKICLKLIFLNHKEYNRYIKWSHVPLFFPTQNDLYQLLPLLCCLPKANFCFIMYLCLLFCVCVWPNCHLMQQQHWKTKPLLFKQLNRGLHKMCTIFLLNYLNTYANENSIHHEALCLISLRNGHHSYDCSPSKFVRLG